MRSSDKIPVYLEIGAKRTFAAAIEWPGWCRSAREASAAITALLDYGQRYARVLRPARHGFRPPTDASAFTVAERLEGNATTDFGAPGAVPASDLRPIHAAEIRRQIAVIRACWRAFDASGLTARGRELRKGPRGGCRELEGIIRHVLEAESAYLERLGWKVAGNAEGDPREELRRVREEVGKALKAAATAELPERGPRGGIRWKPRYFVRRVAWHVLDHAWEIEDRLA